MKTIKKFLYRRKKQVAQRRVRRANLRLRRLFAIPHLDGLRDAKDRRDYLKAEKDLLRAERLLGELEDKKPR